uniref:Uncharacterized protein n=1 Tax=Molossus molossus TaxID=27622 RepID=A0A7J8I7Y4_MOLMO|nr:hypothetical protein HJG59_010533 [Molossus molossus]
MQKKDNERILERKASSKPTSNRIFHGVPSLRFERLNMKHRVLLTQGTWVFMSIQKCYFSMWQDNILSSLESKIPKTKLLEGEKGDGLNGNDIGFLESLTPTLKPRRQTLPLAKTEWKCYIPVTRINTPRIVTTKLN